MSDPKRTVKTVEYRDGLHVVCYEECGHAIEERPSGRAPGDAGTCRRCGDADRLEGRPVGEAFWAIQLVEPFDERGEATLAEAALRHQDGLLGARLLPPGPGEPYWRVQALFRDEPEAADWLPDGCRRVLVPPGFARALGIEP